MAQKIVEMKQIKKSYPGVTALSEVDFDVKEGEVHALMGENGAGKSTLMKILAGIISPDSGEIGIGGKAVHIKSPLEALHLGIAMIHQELNPIPDMTVAENIYIGREPKLTRFGMLDKKAMNDMTQELLAKLNLDIKPKTMMRDLSVAQIQMVDIAKAISCNSKVIIMDEPTSAITDREVEKLFEFIGMLKGHGVGIVYISHKLDEVFKIADRVTVLRDGKFIAERKIGDVDKDAIISMMVGREITDVFPQKTGTIGKPLLKVENLSKENLLHSINFELHEGEILGISGLMGAGRTEMVETVFGLRAADTGTVYVSGKKVSIKSPKDAINAGICLVPEDRKESGLNLLGTVRDNISLINLEELSSFGFVSKRKELKEAKVWIKKLNIKTPSTEQCVNYLSGGNQQKVVIAKSLAVEPQIFILDEPTRGIDVGAKVEIYHIITDLAKQGKGVILISSELPEIMGLSDRVLVMHDGHITGELNKDELSQNTIMYYATGLNMEKEEIS